MDSDFWDLFLKIVLWLAIIGAVLLVCFGIYIGKML